MKANVVFPIESKRGYPVIKILKDENKEDDSDILIVLFSGKDKGIPLYTYFVNPSIYDPKLGTYNTNFDENQFEIFEGSITLNN